MNLGGAIKSGLTNLLAVLAAPVVLVQGARVGAKPNERAIRRYTIEKAVEKALFHSEIWGKPQLETDAGGDTRVVIHTQLTDQRYNSDKPELPKDGVARFAESDITAMRRELLQRLGVLYWHLQPRQDITEVEFHVLIRSEYDEGAIETPFLDATVSGETLRKFHFHKMTTDQLLERLDSFEQHI